MVSHLPVEVLIAYHCYYSMTVGAGTFDMNWLRAARQRCRAGFIVHRTIRSTEALIGVRFVDVQDERIRLASSDIAVLPGC